MLTEWDPYHAINFSNGIIAAIKLDNKQFLKEKLGANYYRLFNKKGKWILSEQMFANIKKWDGSTNGLSGLIQHKWDNGKSLTIEEHFIAFNSLNIKLYIEFKGQKYEFLDLK